MYLATKTKRQKPRNRCARFKAKLRAKNKRRRQRLKR